MKLYNKILIILFLIGIVLPIVSTIDSYLAAITIFMSAIGLVITLNLKNNEL